MTNLVQNESLHLACGRMFLTSLPESTDKSKPFKMRVRSQNTPVISHLTLSQSWSPNPSPQCLPLLNPVTPPASFSTPGLSSSHTDLLSYLQRNQAHSSPRTFALPVPSARSDFPPFHMLKLLLPRRSFLSTLAETAASLSNIWGRAFFLVQHYLIYLIVYIVIVSPV